MAWIGLDDTDTLDSGCTTWDFHLLITHLEDNGVILSGQPNLVRLWPFAPKRTRGNAALCAEFATDYSTEKVCSILENWFFERFSLGEADEIDDTTSACPVLLFSEEKLPELWYWEAVKSHVDVDSRLQQLSNISGIKFWSLMDIVNSSNSEYIRGIIGASSAIAWVGAEDWTFEATAWRKENFIGSKRAVPFELVDEMTKLFPRTILNRDPNAGKSLIAPRTPCPVLYGIRGEQIEDVTQAHLWLQQNEMVETSVAMRVHKSNQATGDHLPEMGRGMVISRIREVKGGHASVTVFDGTSRKTIVAFKQGGEINYLLKSLQIGDVVEWNGLTSPDEDVHLESINLQSSVPRKLVRPICQCGERFHRQGVGQPLRCSQCGENHDSVWISGEIPKLHGWKEPPISHRRHLAKPLDRNPKR
ncbi:MAG: DUF1743 domain-containing protein [Euryarchaeota archaeon]|jgi:tRNA(Ile2)-agmatinylcytidine synthase|nr:DUF1743 domain-containing protein [Euryarchaeota archaeon]